MRLGFPSLVAATALLALPASAMKTGRGDFAFVSELEANGFEPIPSSAVTKALFGPKKGTGMYPCFLADSRTRQAERQKTLLAFIQGESTERDMPDIPVACALFR